jgi:FAD synthase
MKLGKQYLLNGKVAKWKERAFREEGIEDFNVKCKCT